MLKKILIGIFVLSILISCGPAVSDDFIFPKNAENIKIIDKYWARFELDGECFLMHRGGFNNKGWCAITRIDCKN